MTERSDIKYCPLMFIADNIGQEGRQGVSFLNKPGLCMGELCGIYDRASCQCGLISKEVLVYAKAAEE